MRIIFLIVRVNKVEHEESFENRLKNTKLTKKGREIAQHLLDYSTKVGFMSASSIAQEMNISDVTVIRFARSLGYAGYCDMQKALQKRISDYLESSQKLFAYPSQVLELNMEMSSNSSIVELAVNNELKNLHKFEERNEDSAFKQAAEIILASKRKVVVGFRGSASVAGSMGMRLRYLVDDVFDVVYVDPNALYPVYTLTNEDCLIVFGFVNYPRMSIEAVELAKKRGAKIITVTDKETAPISYGADVVIICSVSGISFSSYTCPLLASEMIVASMAKILGPSTDLRNKELVESMQRSAYFTNTTVIDRKKRSSKADQNIKKKEET